MIFHLNKIVIKTNFQNTSNTSVERLYKFQKRNCEQAIKEELQYCQEISWGSMLFGHANYLRIGVLNTQQTKHIFGSVRVVIILVFILLPVMM